MTLGARVVVRSLIVMAAVLVGSAVLTFELVRVAGRNDVDDLLRGEAATLSAALASELPAVAGEDGILSGTEAEQAADRVLTVHPSGPRHVSVITVDDVRFQSAGGPPELAALARGDLPAPRPGSIRTVDTEAGAVREIDQAVTIGTGSTIAVVSVLASLDDAHSTAWAVLALSSVAGLIALAAGATILSWVVRKSLRPLNEVGDAAAAISTDDLTTRVPVPHHDDEVARLAREVNAMLDRIEAGDLTRRRYLAAISHEVRTPLSVAQGHLELLDANGAGDADEVRRSTAIVQRELDRLRRVLDDLMTVARGDDGIEVREEAIFVPDLMQSVRERISARHPGSTVSITDVPPVVLVGDEARLEQCLLNLVANALDHTGDDTTVRIDVVATDDTVRFTVSDDGPGIHPDLLPHVFEPFVTTRDAGRDRTSGLGLAVVEALTRAHGGTVTLHSDSSGTQVMLSLPAARA